MTVSTIAVAMSKALVLACIVLVAQTTTVAALAADARYTQAVYDYQHKFYQSAIRNLTAVCAEAPHNGLAHYYLANCYLNVSDKDRAIVEYSTALNNTQDAAIQMYCRKAIASLSPATPKGVPTLGGVSPPIPLPASFDRGLQASAVRKITEQSLVEKQRLERIGNIAADQVGTQTKSRAAQLRRDGESLADRMSRELVQGTTDVPKYSKTQVAAVRAWYEEQAKDAEVHGQKTSDTMVGTATKRQKAINESAESLRSQLSRTPGLADSTALEPLGTNLFVRNYQPISRMLENTPPATPALGKAESISPKSATAESAKRVPPLLGDRNTATSGNTKPGPTVTASADGRKVVQTDVRGHVLK